MAQRLQIITGIETVAVNGTAVQFQDTDTFVRAITITANSGNVPGEHIVVGDSNVVGAIATRRGHPLAPGESLVISAEGMGTTGMHGQDSAKLINLRDLWVDSVSNTEHVSWLALL